MNTVKKVKLNFVDEIAILSIDNPPVNTLSMQTMGDLHSALSEVEQNNQVKVVILYGNGKHFVAGADLKEFSQIESKQIATQMSNIGHQLMARIESFPKPIIASIEGACLGGGLELAMACHIRIAADNAIFGLPEITLGIIPGAGGTQRLTKLIGFSHAVHYILTGDRLDAEEAKRLGLISRVVPRGKLKTETELMANNIARHGLIAIQGALSAILQGYLNSAESGFKQEAESFGICFETFDKKEGINAFLNKRSAQFGNR